MKLLTPAAIGPVEVRNRVVSTAHGSFLEFYRPGASPDRYVAYQERRAAGGAGLLILQPVHVHRSSHALGHYPYDPGDLGEKLAAMAAAVHRHGARVVQQLIHFGGQFRSDGRQGFEPIWAFDDVVTAEGEAAHRMTGAEIEEVIAAFARPPGSRSRPGSTASSCTARTGTCCSSRSAPGATTATTAGASRSRSAGR